MWSFNRIVYYIFLGVFILFILSLFRYQNPLGLIRTIYNNNQSQNELQESIDGYNDILNNNLISKSSDSVFEEERIRRDYSDEIRSGEKVYNIGNIDLPESKNELNKRYIHDSSQSIVID